MSSNHTNETGNDELVSSFIAFTNCPDPSRAAIYLEMSGGDLQTAVELYMEHEGSGSGFQLTKGGGGGGGGGGNTEAADVNTADTLRGAVSVPQGDMEYDVRAPDATQSMRLMDDQAMAADPTFHLMHAMMEEQLAQSAFASLSGHGQRFDARAVVNAAAYTDRADSDNEYQYDDENEEDEDNEVQILASSNGPVVPPRLSDMFAAPTHLIHKAGGFSGARSVAKDSKRWLLVNIQRDAEFSSHALNRDVWRDELVENLIREGFIFWQSMDMAPDGQTFVERYQVARFPHISIIDPRTGRLLWRKEGWTQENPVTAESFSEMAMDFCSRNSFQRPPQAHRPTGPGGSHFTTYLSSSQKHPIQEMTEDEQLQAAMQASMEESNACNGSTSFTAVKVDDDLFEEINMKGTQNSVWKVDDVGIYDVEEANSKDTFTDFKSSLKEKSLIDELLAFSIADEPISGGARLQIRLPDGKRVIRKFALTDTVRTLYAFVAQSNEEVNTNGREFTLLAGFPPSDLILDLDMSLEERKLAGQAIAVQWKSDS